MKHSTKMEILAIIAAAIWAIFLIALFVSWLIPERAPEIPSVEPASELLNYPTEEVSVYREPAELFLDLPPTPKIPRWVVVKAVEGGWSPSDWTDVDVEKIEEIHGMWCHHGYCWNWEEFAFDPLFWDALGIDKTYALSFFVSVVDGDDTSGFSWETALPVTPVIQ